MRRFTLLCPLIKIVLCTFICISSLSASRFFQNPPPQLTTQNQKKLYSTKNQTWIGHENGKVIGAAFVDPFCPYCRRFHAAAEEALKSFPAFKIVIYYVPIFGEQSEYLEKALLASTKQSRLLYEKFLQLVHAQEKVLDHHMTLKIAASAGLNVQKLEKDVESKEITNLLSSFEERAHSFNVTSTPTLFLGDTLIQGELTQDRLHNLIQVYVSNAASS